MTVAAWIARIDRLVWGPGMLALLMGTGVFLTLRTRFLPWRNLGWALRSVLGRQARSGARGAGDVSPFSALMTTLAATIGTGNIAGVATALAAGGPRRPGVDGALRPLRPLLQVCGVPAGRQIPPPQRPGRDVRRPHVHHAARPAAKAAGRCAGALLRPLHHPGLPGDGRHGPGQLHRSGPGGQLCPPGPDLRRRDGPAGLFHHPGRHRADLPGLLGGGPRHGGPLSAGGPGGAAGAPDGPADALSQSGPPGLLPDGGGRRSGRGADRLRSGSCPLGHCPGLLLPRGGHGLRRHPPPPPPSPTAPPARAM